jgi:hypothetical protein
VRRYIHLAFRANNLGIKTYVNGTLTSNIVIDTSQVATDTIQYVATDQNGLTATSTRTVIIEPAEAPSIIPTAVASSTATTTSSADNASSTESGGVSTEASSTNATSTTQ